MKSVTLSASLKGIQEYAFSQRTSLQEISIPASVSFVGEYAFFGCMGLTAAHIPKSVSAIMKYAFSDCERVSDVYYAGTEASRKNLSIAKNNEALTSAQIHCLENL